MQQKVATLGQALTQQIVEDDLEPVEKGRLSFIFYTVFYRLWRALYFITRICMAYFSVLAAVLLAIAILNGVVGFIFNFYLPRALGLSNSFLVSTSCLLVSLIFVAPIAALIWIAFLMIPEVWSSEEFPRTRIMATYILTGLKKVSTHQLSNKVSVTIQFCKLVTFTVALIVALSISDGSTYGTIEIFVLAGCLVGVAIYVAWLPLVITVELAKYFKRDLTFPDTRVYLSIANASMISSEGVQKSEGRRPGVIVIGVLMILHGLTTLIILAVTMQGIGSTVGSIVGALTASICGIFFTYWIFFSSDRIMPDVIPSPNEDPQIVLTVEKNLKLLKVEPIPPRRFARNIGLIFAVVSIATAMLVLSNQFLDSVFRDTCNERSNLGMDKQLFPSGIRSPNNYRYDIKSSVCHQRWHTSQLNALDMAFLAQAAYEDNANNRSGACASVSAVAWLNDVYRFARINGATGADWVVRSTYGAFSVVHFYELFSPSRGVTVFVVRGELSDRTADILETADMYSPAACFQFFSTFVPLSLSLPASKVSNLLYYVSFADRVFTRPLPTYYEVVGAAIRRAMARGSGHPWYIPDNNSVYVVGHGLGGAVAKAAGSSPNVNITSVSFNGPGLLFSARSFGVDAAVVETNVNNIVLTNNRFALLLDSLGGSTFRIDCLTSNLVSCHTVYAVICKLIATCGFPNYNFLCQ